MGTRTVFSRSLSAMAGQQFSAKQTGRLNKTGKSFAADYLKRLSG